MKRIEESDGYYWAKPRDDECDGFEPAFVYHHDGVAYQVWFTGMDTPFLAEQCIIKEKVTRKV